MPRFFDAAREKVHDAKAAVKDSLKDTKESVKGVVRGTSVGHTASKIRAQMAAAAERVSQEHEAEAKRLRQKAAASQGACEYMDEPLLPPEPTPEEECMDGYDCGGGEAVEYDERYMSIEQIDEQIAARKERQRRMAQRQKRRERQGKAEREEAERRAAAKQCRQRCNALVDREDARRHDITATEAAVRESDVAAFRARAAIITGGDAVEQRAAVAAAERLAREALDAKAARIGQRLLKRCRNEAQDMEREAERRRAAAEARRIEERRREREARAREQEQRRRADEAARRAEEAARIAAVEAEAEKLRLEAEAEAARKQREAEARKRREEEEARERAARRREAEARRAKEKQQREAAERRRKEQEENRRREEAARIVAANAAEKARLEAEAARERRERDEEEARRRRDEEELAAQIAANESDDNASDGDHPETVHEPTMEGQQVPLFKGEAGAGVSCRIVQYPGTAHETWGFFNANGGMQLEVTIKFSGDGMKPLGDTKTRAIGGGKTEFTATIYPHETRPFARGRVNGYAASWGTRPLSQEYEARVAAERRARVEVEMKRVRGLGESDEFKRLAKCVAGGVRFLDVDFPPDDASITAGRRDGGVATSPWCDPAIVLPKGQRARLITQGVSMDDVSQGQLGDCWFVSSVASVAEWPERVLRLITPPVPPALAARERALGAYRVWLCKGGWWKNWVIDDYRPGALKPRFAQNKHDPREMWASIIEKAYAKAHSGYANLRGGDTSLALKDLTGYAVYGFAHILSGNNHHDRDRLFEQILRWDQEDYVMTIATGGAVAWGLARNHSYTLVGAVETGGRRLCRLRNPWGEDEWTGAWSDRSPLWEQNPAIARACGYSPDDDDDDGSFWMDWADVTKYFDSGSVCFARTGWSDLRVRLPIAKRKPAFAVFIHVSAPVDVHLTLWQPCSRCSGYKARYHGAFLGERQNGRYATTLYDTRDPSEEKRDRVPFTSGTLLIAARLQPTSPDAPYMFSCRPFDDADADAPYETVMGIASGLPVGEAFTVELRAVHTQTTPTAVTSLPLVEAAYQMRRDDGRELVEGRASQIERVA